MLTSASADPTCGKCGYCVRGLQACICPECGSDLQQVGIRTGRRSRFILPLLRVTIWSIVLPVPAVLISALLFAYVLPVVRERHLLRTVMSHRSAHFFTALTIRQDGRRLVWGGRDADAHVRLTDMTILCSRPGATPLRVNLVTGGFQYIDITGKQVISRSGFDCTTVLNWLGECGFNRSDPLVKGTAADVIVISDEMANPTVSTAITRATADPAPPTSEFLMHYTPEWLEVGVPVFWIAVWLAGAWKLARPHRSRT